MQVYRLRVGEVCGSVITHFSVDEKRESLTGPVPARKRDEKLRIQGASRRVQSFDGYLRYDSPCSRPLRTKGW